MTTYDFPELLLADWQPTRDTIKGYAMVIGKIRRALTPARKHWWHVSLEAGVCGLTTGLIPHGQQTFSLTLNLVNHQLEIATNQGQQWHTPLHGQSVATFYDQTMDILKLMALKVTVNREQFADDMATPYNPAHAARFWHILSQIDTLFKEFRAAQRGETGPVVFWPHHVDLAMLWFSGRLVPDQDPENPEWSDEQMNIGFLPADDYIPEAYFYITAYPLPDGLTDTPLPPDAYWLTESFTGAIMPYSALVGAENPGEKLLTFWRTVITAGAKLMS